MCKELHTQQEKANNLVEKWTTDSNSRASMNGQSAHEKMFSLLSNGKMQVQITIIPFYTYHVGNNLKD